ncbi:MAG TPA: hypothetical protein VFV50_10850, partial [Bdellovibrionales bacterium]|nr:hypothetical protein [Bdellovibrionales bacterium]
MPRNALVNGAAALAVMAALAGLFQNCAGGFAPNQQQDDQSSSAPPDAGEVYAPGDADFFVATNGNDNWSGKLAAPNDARTDGPLASIPAAQAKVRALVTAEPNRARPIVVQIRGGTYRLTSPLTFTAEDSGTAEHPIVYQNYGDEAVELSGGRVIPNWTRVQGNLWKAPIQPATWRFAQLYINGERRYRSRYPSAGYLRIAGLVRQGDPGGQGCTTDSFSGDLCLDRFRFNAGDIQANVVTNFDELEVRLFLKWVS